MRDLKFKPEDFTDQAWVRKGLESEPVFTAKTAAENANRVLLEKLKNTDIVVLDLCLVQFILDSLYDTKIDLENHEYDVILNRIQTMKNALVDVISRVEENE